MIVGGSFGAGHYAMCGKALRSAVCVRLADRALRGHERRFRRRHPGGNQDQAIGAQRQEAERRRTQGLFESVKKTYDEQTDPRYGAARLWIDKIIDPVETRDAITQALEAAALNPDVPEFKVGVLQT